MFKRMFTPNSFIKSFLFFFAVFAQSNAQSVAERFRYTGNPEIIAPAAALIIIGIVAFIIIHVTQEKIKAKSIKEYANYKFAEKAKTTKLNLAEQTLLKSIAWNVAPQMLPDVFTSMVIFENAVDIELKKLIGKFGEDTPKTQNTADMIFGIRRKLGFDKIIMEKAIESTRNIEKGLNISLFAPMGGLSGTNAGRTKVLDNQELYFTADYENLRDFFLQNGQKNSVIARFTRQQDANYTVPLTIRTIETDNNIITFYHTTSLERHQSRKYARISVDTPMQCKIIKRADENAPATGENLENTTLNDISGGGLSFLAKASLSIDDIVIFSFLLRGQKFAIKGKIVAITTQDGTHNVYYKHRVAYYNPKQSDIERIIKFIYEKQLEKIQLG